MVASGAARPYGGTQQGEAYGVEGEDSMKSAYRVLAYIIAAQVVIQAAAIAFAFAGLGIWIDDGATLDKAVLESEPEFTGVLGFPIHFLNGMLIPLVSIALLIVSFFAGVAGGAKWAATVLGLAILQVALGLLGHESPYFGLLHGINALALFSVALMAGKRVKSMGAAASGGVATA